MTKKTLNDIFRKKNSHIIIRVAITAIEFELSSFVKTQFSSIPLSLTHTSNKKYMKLWMKLGTFVYFCLDFTYVASIKMPHVENNYR